MALEVTGLSPVISVFDMRKALHFYRDQLGYSLCFQWTAGQQPEPRSKS